MKKLAKDLLLFLPIFVVAYLVAVCVFGEFFPYTFRKNIIYNPGSGGFLHSRIRDVKNYSNVDILFIGTSHCYRGFDTRIFDNAGYSSFNFGSSMQTPIVTQAILEKYIDQLNPRLVVYDVNPQSFANNGVESAISLMSNDEITFETVRMAFQINEAVTYHSLIFAFYKQLFGNKFSEPAYKESDKYITGGFVETELVNYKKSADTVVKPEFETQQIRAFQNIIKFLKSRKTDYILVRVPVASAHYNGMSNNDFVNAWFTQHGRFYDFNRHIPLQDSVHFFDENHLNSKGVAVFNEYFIKRLDGIFPK